MELSLLKIAQSSDSTDSLIQAIYQTFAVNGIWVSDGANNVQILLNPSGNLEISDSAVESLTDTAITDLQLSEDESTSDSDVDLSSIIEMLSTISNNIDDISANISTISKDVSTVGDNVDTINTNTSSIEKTVDDINTDVGSIKTVVNSINTNVDQLSSDVSSVSNNISSISESVDTVSGDVNTISTNTSSIEKTVDDINTDVDSIKTVVNSINTNVKQLSSDVSSVSSNTTTILTDVTSIKSEMDVTSIKSALDKITEYWDEISDELYTLFTKVTSSYATWITIVGEAAEDETELYNSLKAIAESDTLETLKEFTEATDTISTKCDETVSAILGVVNASANLILDVETLEKAVDTINTVNETLTEIKSEFDTFSKVDAGINAANTTISLLDLIRQAKADNSKIEF